MRIKRRKRVRPKSFSKIAHISHHGVAESVGERETLTEISRSGRVLGEESRDAVREYDDEERDFFSEQHPPSEARPTPEGPKIE